MTRTMVKVIPYNRMIKYMIILLYIIALQLMFTIWPLIQIHILFFSRSFFCLMGPVSDSS